MLRVVAPGPMTTLQDGGRIGHQRFGIPVSNAMDPVALAAANLLVGNPRGTAALEIAYLGPTLRVEAESVRFACAGGTATIEVLDADGEAPPRKIAPLTSVRLTRGQSLRIGGLSGSIVGYLAVAGGFDVVPFLGSKATFVRGGLGGFCGRALQAGDLLPLAAPFAPPRDELMLAALDVAAPSRVRVVLGPQDDYFSEVGLDTFFGSTFTVSAATDRMGMRLEGPAIAHKDGFNIVSDGIAPGAIQVPGDGLPIVLLADRQTTGGYPKIATVISADLPGLGRLGPGASLSFERVDIATAVAARRALTTMIDGLAAKLAPAGGDVDIAARLLDENLVGGFIDMHAEPMHADEQHAVGAAAGEDRG
ncbi:MAG: biotin-dependent carboxyltransferase [Rhodoplanes sp.]|uniref:5-oxoprolinase subunit C family protein n=1 Tax=Rhodoplanes sp. TaxID=1968906 RepID=UPI0017D72EBE|nr:biotin-dependent carboxyltransferase family protein [Rhodoplanes sp.]NVO15162.1 biotin-dependent carboxyltransferase [Rhodoplanes sp.]